MNLLVPSVGRKFPLVKLLARALEKRGRKVVAADTSPLASGLYAAHEKILLPPVLSAQFIPALLDALKTQEIKAVLPVRDAELRFWSGLSLDGKLPGVEVLLSPLPTLETCLDKWLAVEAAGKLGVKVPETRLYSPGSPLPAYRGAAFVKPRSGAGGRGAARAGSKAMLEAVLSEAGEEMLVQEFITGEEYSVDCFADGEGTFRAVVARERIRVVGGQSDVGRTLRHPGLLEAANRLGAGLRFKGVVNLQFILGREGPVLIDMNPRFPGGIEITALAGADFAEWLAAGLFNERCDYAFTFREIQWVGYQTGFGVEVETA